MMNKLILFCTFAIFMLALGGAVTPVWAHAECGPGGKGKHSEGHPHCGVVNDGTTNDGSLYLVWVDGVCKEWDVIEDEVVCLRRAYGVCSIYDPPLYGCVQPPVDGICVEWVVGEPCRVLGDCDNFVEDSVCLVPAYGVCADVLVCHWMGYDLGIPPYSGHDPVGKKEAVTVNLKYINMDLSFFQGEFNDDSDGDNVSDGVECFTDAPRLGGQTVLSIEHEKVKGKAEAALKAVYVFSGSGTDGTPQVGYRLKLSTSDSSPVDSGWRPTGKNQRFDVTFDQWELSSQKDIACTGSGVLNTTISIEKTN